MTRRPLSLDERPRRAQTRGRPALPPEERTRREQERRERDRRRRRSGSVVGITGAELEATRALLVRALRSLEARAELVGLRLRYVDDAGAPCGPWAAHLARAAGVAHPSELSHAWAGRSPARPSLARVEGWIDSLDISTRSP